MNIQFSPELLIEKAEKYNLDPQVVAAMVRQESDGNTFATRYEPNFYKNYIENKPNTGFFPKPYQVSEPTELRARSTSYGLMQVMGLTARIYNDFKNPYLVSMVVPEIGLDQGCKFLRYCLERAKKSLKVSEESRSVYDLALRFYNGGSSYAPKIREHIKLGNHLRFLPDDFQETKKF